MIMPDGKGSERGNEPAKGLERKDTGKRNIGRERGGRGSGLIHDGEKSKIENRKAKGERRQAKGCGTGRGIQSTEYRIQSTEYRVGGIGGIGKQAR